jgi:PleD family two-component response regulator
VLCYPGATVRAKEGFANATRLLPLNRLNGLHAKTTQTTIDIRYSAGWTDYIPGESVDDLLKRADELLYANKRNPKALLVSSVVAHR